MLFRFLLMVALSLTAGHGHAGDASSLFCHEMPRRLPNVSRTLCERAQLAASEGRSVQRRTLMARDIPADKANLRVLVLGGVAYGIASIVNRHFRNDLLPERRELAPAHLWHDIREHARLRFPKGEAARRYNVLQKLAYCGTLFGLLPLMVLTGLTMSPAMDAAWPWLLDLFGGRQSARSIHFIAAMLIATFIAVHLLMVLLAGPFNEIRSMITGRYRLP